MRSALDTVSLASRRALPARVLSQGQRRRVGLARLSLLARPLWILDEPATALDAAGTGMLAQMIAAHLDRGGLAVAATHAPLGLPPAQVESIAARMMATIPSAQSAPVRADTAGAVLPGLRWALARDIKLALRSRAELAVQLLFYVIVVSLFPLATTPERTLLSAMGPGVLWVAALLASLLSLPRLFAADYADGTLEQIALSPSPLEALVAGKVLAHWLTTGLPIVLLAPLLGVQYAMDGESLAVLSMALLLGTPILSLLGAIGAALTLGLRAGGSLLALLDSAAVCAGADLRSRRRRSRASGTRRRREPVAARRGTASSRSSARRLPRAAAVRVALD